MHVKISISSDLQHRLETIKILSQATVQVGLLKNADPHLKFILRIQEHGSPINNIPPRKVITPALNQPETRKAMAQAMADAVQEAWDGKDPSLFLKKAGQTGADGIRAYIDSHIPPPNSPATVARKGFDLPLYDTGTLYRAFDYEVIWK